MTKLRTGLEVGTQVERDDCGSRQAGRCWEVEISVSLSRAPGSLARRSSSHYRRYAGHCRNRRPSLYTVIIILDSPCASTFPAISYLDWLRSESLWTTNSFNSRDRLASSLNSTELHSPLDSARVIFLIFIIIQSRETFLYLAIEFDRNARVRPVLKVSSCSGRSNRNVLFFFFFVNSKSIEIRGFGLASGLQSVELLSPPDLARIIFLFGFYFFLFEFVQNSRVWSVSPVILKVSSCTGRSNRLVLFFFPFFFCQFEFARNSRVSSVSAVILKVSICTVRSIWLV